MNKRIIKKLSGAIKKRLRKINLRQIPENMKMRWYWSKRHDFYLPPETFGCSKNRYNKQAKYEFNKNVKFSILVPLYNTPENFLKEMIGSVLFQTYKNWELCLADGSDAEHNYVEKICKEIAEKDQRIKYQKLEKNGGISKNTNVCIDMATGDYISLFDHDDLLHPCALFETMKAICENDADFVYTDEAVFQSPNVHNINDTMFKPDYSLYYFNSINYICHFSTFKRELLNTIGYYNSEMDGAQDFDLFLRISEVTSKIYHIKKCLYYWRASVSSTAGGLNSKNYALEAGRLALQKHFERINIPAEVYVDKKTNLYRVNYFMSEKPLVSLILINDDTVNMKDYITSTSITKLIGSSAGYVGYNEKNTPFESLKHHPVSIILLEDYNYTHPTIKALFNTITSTGKLTLNNNETINFENTIIIKTTQESNKSKIGFIEKQTKKNILSFNPLSKNTIKKIITKQNKNLTNEQIEKIIEKSNYLEENAKNINNLINENLVNFNEVTQNL